jgi:hypothetical protein
VPLLSEINADFLAGFYLGVRKLALPSLNFDLALDLFKRLGAAGEDNPTRTHGNSKERMNAAEAGFTAGFLQRRTLAERNSDWVGLHWLPQDPAMRVIFALTVVVSLLGITADALFAQHDSCKFLNESCAGPEGRPHSTPPSDLSKEEHLKRCLADFERRQGGFVPRAQHAVS